MYKKSCLELHCSELNNIVYPTADRGQTVLCEHLPALLRNPGRRALPSSQRFQQSQDKPDG